MSDEERQAEGAAEEAGDEAADEAEGADSAGEEEQPAWAAELEEFPLREPSEDPRWAIWVVYVWTGFAVFCLVSILVLIALGFFYD